MPRASTIRGLERGLRVLTSLHECPIASLHELYVATRIPKPSLLRILSTLEKAGLVSRRLADGGYRVSGNLGRMARKGDRHDRVAEAAAPALDRLCQKVKWPSDLFVPAGECMERRETSRPHSPFVLRSNELIAVGQRVGWLMTGVGRAYLAFCPDREREQILSRLRRSDRPENRLARDPKRLEKIVVETRARGYATRDPGFVGGGYGSAPYDDGLAAIVVPLQDGARVHGSINILWIKTAFTIEEFAARHLDDLRNAAIEIVDTLRSQSTQRARESQQAPR
jgi:IclR family mhp operon transcriptional activator